MAVGDCPGTANRTGHWQHGNGLLARALIEALLDHNGFGAPRDRRFDMCCPMGAPAGTSEKKVSTADLATVDRHTRDGAVKRQRNRAKTVEELT